MYIFNCNISILYAIKQFYCIVIFNLKNINSRIYLLSLRFTSRVFEHNWSKNIKNITNYWYISGVEKPYDHKIIFSYIHNFWTNCGKYTISIGYKIKTLLYLLCLGFHIFVFGNIFLIDVCFPKRTIRFKIKIISVIFVRQTLTQTILGRSEILHLFLKTNFYIKANS